MLWVIKKRQLPQWFKVKCRKKPICQYLQKVIIWHLHSIFLEIMSGKVVTDFFH